MMKNKILCLLCAAMLAACGNTGSGSQTVYGEIKGGVESSRSF